MDRDLVKTEETQICLCDHISRTEISKDKDSCLDVNEFTNGTLRFFHGCVDTV